MYPNTADFFYEATKRICSNLEVDRFLQNSFLYIRQFVPLDYIFLTRYDPESGKQLAIAGASLEGATTSDVELEVSGAARKVMDPRGPKPALNIRAGDHPATHPWIEKGKLNANDSLLTVRLTIGQDVIGAVHFVSRSGELYTREEIALLEPLREPIGIAVSNCLRYRELEKLKDLLAEDNRFLQDEMRRSAGESIIGADFGLKEVMDQVQQVSSLSSPVLLLGETGTGKEIIANAIHNLSPRRDGPFIKFNCGAVPENLVDSELFGHEKGAFTGALNRMRGRFERAHRGTIFIDEVGELHPSAQVRLLRVLQEKEFERVGGTEPVRVDIRVIAATHRNLDAMIAEGRFREDLYFRLKVFPITIPPLRRRTGDIGSLAAYFFQKKAREFGMKDVPAITPVVMSQLTAYAWPGNVRELQNEVERALILSKGRELDFSHLPAGRSPETATVSSQNDLSGEADVLGLDSVIKAHISRVMKLTGGKVGGEGGAADLLELNPSTLRKKMKKLGIPFGRNAR